MWDKILNFNCLNSTIFKILFVRLCDVLRGQSYLCSVNLSLKDSINFLDCWQTPLSSLPL